LLDHGAELDERNLDKEPLNEEELNAIMGTRDYKQFLNPRNELYRTKRMAENPPPRAEAIRLMAQTPNLIRRPVVIRGDQIVLGFDEAAYQKLLKTA
jgi:arsenate reductase (glutaredoxin)